MRLSDPDGGGSDSGVHIVRDSDGESRSRCGPPPAENRPLARREADVDRRVIAGRVPRVAVRRLVDLQPMAAGRQRCSDADVLARCTAGEGPPPMRHHVVEAKLRAAHADEDDPRLRERRRPHIWQSSDVVRAGLLVGPVTIIRYADPLGTIRLRLSTA
jgi:hypothetical protein